MKKMILGASMLISGVIGFVGLLIASVSKVQPGAVSTVYGALRGTDYFIAAIFLILAIIGLIIEIVEVKRKS